MREKSFQDNTLRSFIDAISSKTPTPGGGTVSAAVSLFGISLGIMCAKFSKSPKLIAQLQKLRKRQAPLLDKDSSAYKSVRKALALPKYTAQEIRRRKSKIQKALTYASQVPLKSMNLSLKALVVLDDFAPKCNKNLASDLGAATLLLTSSIKSAYLNILVNSKFIKNKNIKEKLIFSSQDIILKAEVLQKKLTEKVNEILLN